MRIPLLPVAAMALLIGLSAEIAPARAEAALKFCDIDTVKKCMVAALKNRSTATVLSTEVTQKHGTKDGYHCERDVRNITRNMTGGGNSGMQLRIHVHPSCRYEVKFNTTAGCGGDKIGQLSSNNLKNRRRQMKLVGACGTLKTKTGRADDIDHNAGDPLH